MKKIFHVFISVVFTFTLDKEYPVTGVYKPIPGETPRRTEQCDGSDWMAGEGGSGFSSDDPAYIIFRPGERPTPTSQVPVDHPECQNMGLISAMKGGVEIQLAYVQVAAFEGAESQEVHIGKDFCAFLCYGTTTPKETALTCDLVPPEDCTIRVYPLEFLPSTSPVVTTTTTTVVTSTATTTTQLPNLAVVKSYPIITGGCFKGSCGAFDHKSPCGTLEQPCAARLTASFSLPDLGRPLDCGDVVAVFSTLSDEVFFYAQVVDISFGGLGLDLDYRMFELLCPFTCQLGYLCASDPNECEQGAFTDGFECSCASSDQRILLDEEEENCLDLCDACVPVKGSVRGSVLGNGANARLRYVQWAPVSSSHFYSLFATGVAILLI